MLVARTPAVAVRLVAVLIGVALALSAAPAASAESAAADGTAGRLEAFRSVAGSGTAGLTAAAADSSDDVQAAQAGSGCFTDAANDTRRLEDDAPSNGPRADILEHCAAYGAQLALRLRVAQPTDPAQDENWRAGTFAAWFLETTGDDEGDFFVEYSLDADGRPEARVMNIQGESPTVTCSLTARYDGRWLIVGGLGRACIDRANRVAVSPGMFYDAGGETGDGPVHYDTAPNVGGFETAIQRQDVACPAPHVSTFNDRRNVSTTHRPGVDCLFELGVALGVVEGNARYFRPQANVTRGQFAGFLFRSLEVLDYDLPEASGERFSDVPEDHTFSAEIHRLAAAEVLTGFGDGTFRPEARIRRDQTASLLVQAVEVVTDRALRPQDPGTHFRDIGGNVHRANIDAAFENDLISGIEAPTAQRRGRYQPAGLTNRERMASVLVRFITASL